MPSDLLKTELDVKHNQESQSHKWLVQNNVTNNMSRTFVSDGIEIDDVTGDATLERGNFTLYIHQYSSLSVKDLRASFHRMIDIILIKFSESFTPNKAIKIKVRDYMKMCNLDNIRRAREQLKIDLDIFFNCSVSYQSQKVVKSDDCRRMHLCNSYDPLLTNSSIEIILGDEFYNQLSSNKTKRMLIPIVVLQCNFRKNPNSYFLGKKITTYDRINFNKNHNNVISIKSLLKECPKLKDWEKSQQKKRDVVQAFNRDMHFLEEQIRWEYCKAKGEPLNDKELELIENDDFNTFINLYIKYDFTKEYVDLMNTHIKPIKSRTAISKSKS